jgi:hypothetical protein
MQQYHHGNQLKCLETACLQSSVENSGGFNRPKSLIFHRGLYSISPEKAAQERIGLNIRTQILIEVQTKGFAPNITGSENQNVSERDAQGNLC